MALPPISVLFEPVTCMPAWVAYYESIPNTTVSSGCSTNTSCAGGNVNCDPRAMAAAAAAKIGRPVSVEAYTLARYVSSEVGSGPVPERVAVIQDVLNRVKYVEKHGDILKVLLYRQAAGHRNRGFYGPIHCTDPITGKRLSPFGRWAATSKDPSLRSLILALDILDGKIPIDFNKGADDQLGPEGLDDPIRSVRYHAEQKQQFWVGSLPGVDPWRTMQYRTIRDLDPASTEGKALISRGEAAMRSARPNWSSLPICSTSSGIPAINFGSKGSATAFFGIAILGTTALVALSKWLRRQKVS